MLLLSDVTFEALYISDEPYHISEYAVEGEHEDYRDHGCQMERSRLQGHEQRTLQYRWSGTHTHKPILDYVWYRWSDSYLQASESGRCSTGTLKTTESAFCSKRT